MAATLRLRLRFDGDQFAVGLAWLAGLAQRSPDFRYGIAALVSDSVAFRVDQKDGGLNCRLAVYPSDDLVDRLRDLGATDADINDMRVAFGLPPLVAQDSGAF